MVLQKSGIVNMIDCIVIKRYPIYYSEYANGKEGKSQRFTRSRESVEILQQKQIDSFNEQAKMLMADSKKGLADQD